MPAANVDEEGAASRGRAWCKIASAKDVLDTMLQMQRLEKLVDISPAQAIEREGWSTEDAEQDGLPAAQALVKTDGPNKGTVRKQNSGKRRKMNKTGQAVPQPGSEPRARTGGTVTTQESQTPRSPALKRKKAKEAAPSTKKESQSVRSSSQQKTKHSPLTPWITI